MLIILSVRSPFRNCVSFKDFLDVCEDTEKKGFHESGLGVADDGSWSDVVTAMSDFEMEREIVICAYDNDSDEDDRELLGQVVVKQSVTKGSIQPCCSEWCVQRRFILHSISYYFQR